jgi:DNA-binding NarL/FixJ family response regulator
MGNNIIVASTSETFAEYVRKDLERVTKNEPIVLAFSLTELKVKIKTYQPRLIFLESNLMLSGTACMMEDLLKTRKKIRFVIFNFEKLTAGDVVNFYNKGAVGYVNYREGKAGCIAGYREVLDGNESFPKSVQDLLPDFRSGDSGNEKLTAKDMELIRLLNRGENTRKIAVEMNLTYETVRNYRSRIYKRCGVRNSVELIIHSILMGYESVVEIVEGACDGIAE